MFKKPVTFTNYDGEKEQVNLYFHLNKFEWLELEAYTKGGLIQNLSSAVDTNNAKKTIDILKKIILRAYGEKDPETGAFVKDDDLAIRFSKTEAFSELFYELAYNEEKSKEFFMGLIPPEIRDQAMAELDKKKKPLVQLPIEQSVEQPVELSVQQP